jgi:hypothetical protein
MPITPMSSPPTMREVNAQADIISEKSTEFLQTTSAFVNAALELAQSARTLKATLTQMRSSGHSVVTNSKGQTFPIVPLINALKECKDIQKSAADKVKNLHIDGRAIAKVYKDMLDGKHLNFLPLPGKIIWGEAQLISVQKKLGKYIDSPNYSSAQRAAAQIIDIHSRCDHPVPDSIEPIARALRDVA